MKMNYMDLWIWPTVFYIFVNNLGFPCCICTQRTKLTEVKVEANYRYIEYSRSRMIHVGMAQRIQIAEH